MITAPDRCPNATTLTGTPLSARSMADKGVPVKVVALGHRSGAVIMVRKESPYRTFADLKGKTIAIPSRFAVDHIFVRKLMASNGLKDGDLTMIELAQPD